MPSRVIRGEINSSRSLAKVSLEADLTFRCLIVAVDDYGRMEADPLILKAALYPRRPKVSPDRVRSWVDELAEEGCVLVYSVGGIEYLQLCGWETHRGKTNRAKESKFPEPMSSIHDSPGNLREILGDSQNLPPSSGSGVGVGVGEGEGGAAAPPTAPRGNGALAPSEADSEPEALEGKRGATEPIDPEADPEAFEALFEEVQTWICCHRDAPGIESIWNAGDSYIRSEIESCLGYYGSRGRRFKDWRLTAINWIRKEGRMRLERRSH